MENVRPIRYRNTSQIDAQKLNTFYVIKQNISYNSAQISQLTQSQLKMTLSSTISKEIYEEQTKVY